MGILTLQPGFVCQRETWEIRAKATIQQLMEALKLEPKAPTLKPEA